MCDLCEKLHTDKSPSTYPDMREWWVDQAKCSTKTILSQDDMIWYNRFIVIFCLYNFVLLRCNINEAIAYLLMENCTDDAINICLYSCFNILRNCWNIEKLIRLKYIKTQYFDTESMN